MYRAVHVRYVKCDNPRNGQVSHAYAASYHLKIHLAFSLFSATSIMKTLRIIKSALCTLGIIKETIQNSIFTKDN